LPPLLIEWSAARVRVLDPLTGESAHGPSIAEAVGEAHRGRDAIIAVGQRSSFIRAVPVPRVKRDELAKLVAVKLGPLLPLGPNEAASGFRLGRDRHGDGLVAVVGAMKTASLRRIHEEAAAKGLRVRTVVPLAFGSWLAARARSLTDCAVVSRTEGALNIDVIANGELRYSRTIPVAEPGADYSEEIAKTFAIAEILPSTVLAAPGAEVVADLTDSREPLEYLGVPHDVDRLLFTLEPPEKARARAAKIRARVAQRAIAAAVVAVAFGGYAVARRSASDQKIEAENARQRAAVNRARVAQRQAEKDVASTEEAKRVLDLAFSPAQSFSDVITVLGTQASPQSWFTGLTLERGKPLLVNGQALTSGSVAKYVADLGRETRFRNVKLVYANKEVLVNKPIVQFVVSGHVVGNLPLDDVGATSKPGGAR